MSAAPFTVGAELTPFARTTRLANWNRFAAVNDEFVDIHMDDEAARAIGMPGVFGMGSLRIAYLHDLLVQALGDDGDIVEFSCEFRGINLKGDRLTCTGTVEEVAEVDGQELATIRLAVVNQDGVDTTPGRATVVRFGGDPRMPTGAGTRRAVGWVPPRDVPHAGDHRRDRSDHGTGGCAAGRGQRHRPVGDRDLVAQAPARRLRRPGGGPCRAMGRARGTARVRPVRLDAGPAVAGRLAVGHGDRARHPCPQRWPAQPLRRTDPSG